LDKSSKSKGNKEETTETNRSNTISLKTIEVEKDGNAEGMKVKLDKNGSVSSRSRLHASS
jgi:hypothetical protein